MKIYTGQISFYLFYLFGIWKPITWKSKWETWLYGFYSLSMIIIYITSILSFIFWFFNVSQPTEIFMEVLFYFMCYFLTIIKKLRIMVKRNTVMEAKEKLLNKLCEPEDVNESEILQRCSNVCRSNTIIYLSFCCMVGTLMTITPLMKRNIVLPLNAWYPFTFESKWIFCLTYLYQVIGLFLVGCTTAAVEGLALTFMLQTCAQLEIIIHRLHLLPELRKLNEPEWRICERESKIISKCVKHHTNIYSLEKKLNEIFGLVIFVQFFSSTISLCAIIYQLSRINPQNSMFWIMITAANGVMIQIFLYCFYGERISEKSKAVADAVYLINWIPLSNRTKSDLILMMRRASKPIQMTGSSAIVMSIETFVKIMKSAYSAYNLLGNV